jgi:hypothetical protein
MLCKIQHHNLKFCSIWPLVDTRHNANLEPGQEISLGIMERQCPEKKDGIAETMCTCASQLKYYSLHFTEE